MNARALGRATLARQLLLERHALDVTDAVGRLCALQAQEAKPPAIALWARGEELYKTCVGKLDAAQGKIEELARRAESARP